MKEESFFSIKGTILPRLVKLIAIVLIAFFVIVLSMIFYERTIPRVSANGTNQQEASEEISEDIPDDWLTQVQKNIRDSEYHVTWQNRTKLQDVDAAWHAPNRAHNFRTYFTEKGIRVIPRTEEDPSWEWGLSLMSYGRSRMKGPVSKATLSVNKNRIDYHRGNIHEWYINDTKGLKQGFILKVPPEEHDSAAFPYPSASSSDDSMEVNGSRLVYLEMALTGTLSPVMSADGQAIDFRSSRNGYVIHYSQLFVHDANDREVPAWMEGINEARVRGIRIVVDDSEAVYPITIDPLATSPSWTAESNKDYASFGISVSTAGDVNGDGYADVIVGAYGYDNGQAGEGRAYVYHGSGSGLSTSEAWTAESNKVGASFGYSVSTAGDVNGDGYADVIVGAYSYDNGQTSEGRAYVYHGSSSGLSTSEAWTAESNQAWARFGISVSTAGDVNGDGYADVIVGAYQYSNGESYEGRAYVYHGSSSGLSTSEAWTAESNQADACFGRSVSTAGDVNGDGYADVIVGAYSYDNGQTSEGRAYVYHGSASGLSTTENWTAESDQAHASFGISVSTAGDVNGDGYADVIVGSYSYSSEWSYEGRAYVYHGSGSGLSTTENWTAESNQAESWFGYSVSTAGDVNGDGYADVIVGAFYYDNGQNNEGRAYVYHGSASGLSTTENWTAESNQAGALFGYSVSTAGDVNGDGYADVIVGAYQYDNGESNEGRAYVYHGSASGLSTTEAWIAESNQADARFGISVSTAGDVNGDGYADVIVGAYCYDNGQDNEGRAYVYHGSASGLSTTENWTTESNQADARFGRSVSTAGDVNGDGYADVIVGASGYDNLGSNEGRAYVYHGSGSGLSTSPNWTAESDQAEASFGISVSTAGDVNGDGYADVIVGADYYDNPETDEGQAYVYHGSASGLSTSPNWTAESNQASAYFGCSVSAAGDVNGDGYADVIVGALLYDNSETDEGRAYVYHGSASGLSTSPNWTAESNQADACFGRSVSTAGDVNGDGYTDVIVGAYAYDNAETDEGRAYVYHGSASGLSTSPNWTAESDQASAYFGRSVSTAGDVNGDGYADVIVGAYAYDNAETDEGRAYAYYGSASGLSTTENWITESNQIGATFGVSVSTAGDVNGDGYADVIVGALFYDNPEADEGRAFLYYGNDGPGLSLIPQQRRVTDTAPIAHLGASDSPDGFRLKLFARSPFGGIHKVKMQWEVKPLGSSLNGIDTKTAVHWSEMGLTGVELSELETGLIDEQVYHWRARIRYHSVTTPFEQHSRWVTIPWNGWQEADLRTGDPAAAGRVPNQADWPGTPLTVEKSGAYDITLTWDVSCKSTDTDYGIYEGKIGSYYSHESRYCSTGGATTKTFTPLAGNTYYLVVPRNSTREGSYGTGSSGERPQGDPYCLDQQIGTCP